MAAEEHPCLQRIRTCCSEVMQELPLIPDYSVSQDSCIWRPTARVEPELLGLHTQVDAIVQCMLETIAEIREFSNASRPLLRLPTELLCKIMSHIPTALHDGLRAPGHRDSSVWRHEFRDAAMIIPISQSCRQLRRIALDEASLWTGIAVGGPSRSCAKLCADRSRGLPLQIFMSCASGEDALNGFSYGLLARSQDILVGKLARNDTQAVLDRLSSGPLPMLESLSLGFQNDKIADIEYNDQLTLTKECAPRLTRLSLISVDLVSPGLASSLTHLALDNFYKHGVYQGVERVLSVCCSLESLYLRQFMDVNEPEPHPEYRLPTPRALPACRRLRRAVFESMYTYLASYILSLILSDQPQLAVQLRHVWDAKFFPVPLELFHGTTRLAIGRYSEIRGHPPPYPRYVAFTWGITASGPQYTIRKTYSPDVDGFMMAAPIGAQTGLGATERVLLHPTVLAGVRELWLVDVSPSKKGHVAPPVASAQSLLRSMAARMPALETVVLVSESWELAWAGGPPSLRLLPDGRDPGFTAPRLNTLRVVHGFPLPPEYHLADGRLSGSDGSLDLSVILDDLSSGAYDYLVHLIIEVRRRDQIFKEQLAVLEEFFSTVQVRVTEQAPTMELPDYCVEPYAWPDKRLWPMKCW
ncbi:hypothetical protein OH77DRAFT_631288 [Trametes cingulata]|nr:hypothetical protein OH77DRAFT_631288 [Trametes cingulata]